MEHRKPVLNNPEDRRDFRRLEVSEGQLGVDLATGVVRPVQASVHNISRSGVLLAVKEDPGDATGTGQCVLRFRSGYEQVRPPVTRGTILRKGIDGAMVRLAIKFAEPLESLET
jgi:hypothetical protein